VSGPAKISFIPDVLSRAARFLPTFMRTGKVRPMGLMAILVVALTAGLEK
jgi:hypothetical protein